MDLIFVFKILSNPKNSKFHSKLAYSKGKIVCYKKPSPKSKKSTQEKNLAI